MSAVESPSPPLRPRLVITSEDTSGRSIVGADVHVPSRRLPGANTEEVRLWGSDASPLELPRAASATVPDGFFPPLGGVRALIVRFDPGDGRPATADIDAVDDESRRVLESTGDVAGGFHRTDSVDIGFVLEGEIVALLEEGETVLRAGDCLVQQGTNHSWQNRSARPCTMAIVVLGATRTEPA